MKKLALTGYKVFFASLVAVALVAQVDALKQVGTFNPANFFSFFTIESNIFAMVVLTISAYYLLAGKVSKKLDFLRGATTLYMAITGIVYVLLLSGADVQTPLPWVNAVLHYIFPIVVLLDWVIDKPKKNPTIKTSLLWLAYPVAYVIYSLVRGPLANNWYPYPFLNVFEHGYVQVLATSLVIAIGGILFALFIGKLPKYLR